MVAPDTSTPMYTHTLCASMHARATLAWATLQSALVWGVASTEVDMMLHLHMAGKCAGLGGCGVHGVQTAACSPSLSNSQLSTPHKPEPLIPSPPPACVPPSGAQPPCAPTLSTELPVNKSRTLGVMVCADRGRSNVGPGPSSANTSPRNRAWRDRGVCVGGRVAWGVWGEGLGWRVGAGRGVAATGVHMWHQKHG